MHFRNHYYVNKKRDTTGGEGDQNGDNPDRLGVYYVPSHEATNPPRERTYQEKAVWTGDGWKHDSEAEIVEAAAEHGPSELTGAWLREFFSDSNHVVGRPEEILGEIENQTPTYTASDRGYETELRTETGGEPGVENIESLGTGDRAQLSAWSAVNRWMVHLADVCEGTCYRWVKGSFAFIFIYFGLQKWPVIQGASPVRPPVRAFVEAVGFGGWIPLAPETGLLFIGIYEVLLGTLWFGTFVEEKYYGTSRLFVGVAMMTVAHQFVGFLPLLLVPGVAFRHTRLWIPFVTTLPFPVALDWLSAFILKNLLFVGAFMYVFVEWAKRYGEPRTTSVPSDYVDTGA